MSIIERVVRAVEKREDGALLQFDKYRLVRKLGAGQQGVVLLAESKLDQRFALKLYRPTDSDPLILAEGIKRFRREVHTLVSLQHRNIVKAFSGGVGAWDEQAKVWAVSEGFPPGSDLPETAVHYFLMEYIQSGSEDLFPFLRAGPHRGGKPRTVSTYQQAELFEQMAVQIGEALRYLHSEKLAHKDVKPQNIRYCPTDSTFVLTDFGFARHTTSVQDKQAIPRTDVEDLVSVQAGEYEKNDLAQLSLVLLRILPELRGVYDKAHFEGIRAALNRAVEHDLGARFGNASDYLAALQPFFEASGGRRWRLTVRTGECLTSSLFSRFDSRLRIPVSGSIHLSKEVRRLIDDPMFQRLRGVRQLGPTSFVYPGATHTRFEHSLGTYWLALRYLESLSLDLEFRRLCYPVDDTIRLGVVAALMHDVGHYPYSHWIEEIDFPTGIAFPSHEERASTLIANSGLAQTVTDVWGISLDDLGSVIEGKPRSRSAAVIGSLLDSPIDVDKLDYLRRDSTHCGVPYGQGFETDRVVDSLCLDPETNRLALTQKGRSVPLAIVTSRNLMYREVYWHKTVRACDAMFKRCFYELVCARPSDMKMISEWLGLADDAFLARLYDATSSNPDLQQLVAPFAGRGRALYKPAYVFSRSATTQQSGAEKFFAKVLYKWDYKGLVDAGARLAATLSKVGTTIRPLQLIVDKAPVKHGEKWNIDKVRLFDGRRDQWEALPSEVREQNAYLESTQQAYVFCHMDHYERLRALTLSDWNSVFDGI